MDQIITILTLILIITFSYFIYKTYYVSIPSVKPISTELPYSENYWEYPYNYPYYGNPNWGWRRGRYGRWGRY